MWVLFNLIYLRRFSFANQNKHACISSGHCMLTIKVLLIVDEVHFRVHYSAGSFGMFIVQLLHVYLFMYLLTNSVLIVTS